MDASTHAKAYDLLQLHLRDSIETISQDKGFIRYLRSSASNREKSSRVKTLLQGYAQCTSLSDLAALNKGKPPKSDNSFQPLPDLSPGSNEWVFIQSSVKNNFVHFPSIMALIRLYCCKLYAMCSDCNRIANGLRMTFMTMSVPSCMQCIQTAIASQMVCA